LNEKARISGPEFIIILGLDTTASKIRRRALAPLLLWTNDA
jgi:hypothetical protein